MAPGGGQQLIAAFARTSPSDLAQVLDMPTRTREYLFALPRPTVGVDLADGMLRRAMIRDVEPALICADTFALPTRTGSFGLVFSSLGLQLMPTPKRAVEELSRVLRPGGSFAKSFRSESSRGSSLSSTFAERWRFRGSGSSSLNVGGLCCS